MGEVVGPFLGVVLYSGVNVEMHLVVISLRDRREFAVSDHLVLELRLELVLCLRDDEVDCLAVECLEFGKPDVFQEVLELFWREDPLKYAHLLGHFTAFY